jgi:hypothetical protein
VDNALSVRFSSFDDGVRRNRLANVAHNPTDPLTRPRLRKAPTRSRQEAMTSSSVAVISSGFSVVFFCGLKRRANTLFCQFRQIIFGFREVFAWSRAAAVGARRL